MTSIVAPTGATSARARLRTRVAQAVIIGATCGGVFVLPYFVASSTDILSASTLAGFNNTVAYAAYVIGLALLALVSRESGGPTVSMAAPSPSARLFVRPPPLVLLLMAGHVLFFAALYRRTGGFVFAEALYFEDAAYRTAAGQLPFVDFRFFYGPLLLFPTSLIAPWVGLWAAYALHFVAAYLVGLYFLYLVLAQLIVSPRLRVLWFVIFAAGVFTPILGLNYTLFRFLLPPLAAMALWHYLMGGTFARWLMSMVMIGAAILCSPDMALVTCLGAAVLLVLTQVGPREARRASPAAGAASVLAALGLAIVALWSVDGSTRAIGAYLGPIATFSAGGWNTQVDPSLPMLALIGLTAVAMVGLWNSFLSNQPLNARPMIAALAVIALLMQRASFGKADVLHVAYSGLPAFLVAAAMTTASAWNSRLVLFGAFACGIAVPLQFYHALLFAPAIAARLSPPSAPTPEPAPAAVSKSAVQSSLRKAVHHFGAEKTYYMHHLEYYRLPIYLEFGLRPFLSHPSLTSAFTSQDIEGVIDELRTGHAIVLAIRDDLASTAPQPRPVQWWTYAFSAPVPGSTVFNLTSEFQFELEKALRDSLVNDYRVDFADGAVVGLTRRESPSVSEGR